MLHIFQQFVLIVVLGASTVSLNSVFRYQSVHFSAFSLHVSRFARNLLSCIRSNHGMCVRIYFVTKKLKIIWKRKILSNMSHKHKLLSVILVTKKPTFHMVNITAVRNHNLGMNTMIMSVPRVV